MTTTRLFSRVWLPALSARPRARRTVGSRSPYTLQRAIPSARGSVTPRSPRVLRDGLRTIDRMCIACPRRVRLSARLTPGRLASPGKPWVFGVGVRTPIVVTHAYIFFSGRSSKPRGSPSAPTGMLPYHASFDASSASATVLMPDHHPRGSARPVSCYALFE